MKTLALFLTAMVIASIIIIGCDTHEPGTTGKFILYLSDAPGDFEEVNIVVDRVDVHHTVDGWVTVNDQGGTYNLLELTNGVTAVLADAELEAGRYTQIRLMIGTGSNVKVDGNIYPLQIPSGLQTGLKLVGTFEIEPDFTYELLLDFDAHRSVHKVGATDQYMLQPAIRLQPLATSGSIAGQVLPAEARAVVTALDNGEVVTTTYADVETGEFKLIHLPEGNYTLQFEAREGEYDSKSMNNVQVNVGQTNNIGVVELE